MPEPTFSFIVPTRNRPEQLLRLCESILANTRRSSELELILVADDDDGASNRFTFPGLNVRIVSGPHGRSMGELNMAGYCAAAGRYLMLLNDDAVVDTPAWDDYVLEVFRTYPDSMVLVHVNDGVFGEALSIFPFVPRAFCELAEGICPTGYLRYRIDDHIHNVFDLMALAGHRRRIFLPDVVFRHLNFTETSEGSAYSPNPEIHAIDTLLFNTLLPARKRLALAAVEHIEQNSRAERRRVLEQNLESVQDSIRARDPRRAKWYPPSASPAGRARVTVGVVSADIRSEFAGRAIDRLKAHTSDFDLVIADNNRGADFNHAREMNRILDFCRTDYLVLMDDDVFVENGWFEGLLRALEPGVGVVCPVHKDRHGRFAYAGVVLQPDDSGHHTHVMSIGDRPQPVQTLCSALMLIDRSRCGNIRLDEIYSKYFLDIAYGLRVWEEGWRVVCSPWTQVTHLAGGTLPQGSERSMQLFEEQRRTWKTSWVETGRMHALRHGIWKTVPDFLKLDGLKREADTLLTGGARLSKGTLFDRGRKLVEKLDAVPAFKNYIAAQAQAMLQDEPAHSEDPRTSAPSILLELVRQSISPRAEPPVPETVTPESILPAEPIVDERPALLEPLCAAPAPGIAAALERFGKTLPYLNSLRPRILFRRGANLFDADYYRAIYPDVAADGVNPLVHFLIAGGFEGRNPHPLFDSAFYACSNPDVANASVNPLGHYLRHGGREQRQPHPLFDPVFYLQRYPDVRRSGLNPLVHFVLYGAAEGRQPHPWFEPDYYLRHCRNPREAAANPLIHFLRSGFGEWAAPHPQFDCEYYLRQNPGVAAAGMNPLVHFVLFGRPAGRWPRAGLNGSAHAGSR